MDNRKFNRRAFSYYMRVLDANTEKLVGHLADISTGGFKMDSQTKIPLNTDMTLRIDVPDEISDKDFIIFIARARWCQNDRFDLTSYNIGFQLINIDPGDLLIFMRMFEKYGAQANNKKQNNDYYWR